MPKAKEVEDEICNLVDPKRFEDEERQSFLGRVARQLSRVDGEEWQKLSAEAQEWSNVAADALNNGTPIPEFNGKVPKAAAAAKEEKVASIVTEEDEDEIETEKPAKKNGKNGKKVKPEKVAKEKKVAKKAKPEKVVKEKKAKKERKTKEGLIPGMKTQLKLILAQDPAMDGTAYLAAAKAEKIEASLNTMRAVRAEFRHTMRVLEHLKLLKNS